MDFGKTSNTAMDARECGDSMVFWYTSSREIKVSAVHTIL
jgi:hypothetical protein